MTEWIFVTILGQVGFKCTEVSLDFRVLMFSHARQVKANPFHCELINSHRFV